MSQQMPSPSRSKSGAWVRLVLHQSLLPVRDIADLSFCCRMKPAYMGPDSPVKEEFKEFCASNAMDSECSNSSCQQCFVGQSYAEQRSQYQRIPERRCHSRMPHMGPVWGR